VRSISQWVHEHVAYEIGATGATTTAADVYTSGKACAGTSLSSASRSAAPSTCRPVCGGYLPEIGVEPPYPPMDFCSWFEAWIGSKWWTFDPRNNEPRIGVSPSPTAGMRPTPRW